MLLQAKIKAVPAPGTTLDAAAAARTASKTQTALAIAGPSTAAAAVAQRVAEQGRAAQKEKTIFDKAAGKVKKLASTMQARSGVGPIRMSAAFSQRLTVVKQVDWVKKERNPGKARGGGT